MNTLLEKEANKKLTKSNRLYSVLSYINQLIVRTQDEQTLFEGACKIATLHGKFDLAWIGLVNENNHKVRLVAESGGHSDDIEYLSDLSFQEKGPTSKVLVSGTHYVINDFRKVPQQYKCQHYSKNHEFQSAIFLPIKKAGRIVGTFNLFFSEIDFFDKEEINLLVEVSDDISFALDVLEKEKQRKTVEKKLELSKSRLKEAQAIALVGSWEYNCEKQVAFCSAEARRINELLQEDNLFSFKYWFQFVHPDDKALVLNKIKEARVSLKNFDFCYRIRKIDGAEKYINLKAQFEKDKAGNPIGIIGTVQDITETKIAEINKEFDKNNISALINNTRDLMWSVNKNKQLITSNIAFDEMIKLLSGKEELDKNNMWDGLRKDLLREWDTYYNRAFTGESFSIIEYFDSPVEMWCEISFYPIRKGNGVIGTACYSRNITDIKKAEAEIINLNEELEDKVMQRTMELANTYVKLHQKAEMLMSASTIIEKKNKDVSDSLNYAKIIQNATVNKKEVLLNHFPNSFLLNMPLHIVSGDFVRVDEKGKHIFVALADCTGHGVPGALLSMIGYSFFNNAIEYRHKIIPSLVLRSLDNDFNQLTKEALMNDGMDVGFCSINSAKMELNFAGAHRPLYIIRNGELTEIKGDNLSIGGQFGEKKKYKNNIFQLQKNDCIYMFSDGYVDQFGGEKGKKYSTKRFKETLISLQHLNMKEQCDELKRIINDWKGKHEQIDDICVLGIKF